MFRRQLYLMCVSVFPLMVCSGMVYSIFALYISELGASKTWIGMIFMTGSAAGAVLAPLLGKLSDKVGRRPILLLSMIGFTLAFSLYAIAESFIHIFPIQALEGATWAALGTTATAYIGDIIPADRRGWAMGIYQRTWFAGWIVGPLLGGFLADTVGFRQTLLLGSGLIVSGFLVMLVYLKEPSRSS